MQQQESREVLAVVGSQKTPHCCKTTADARGIAHLLSEQSDAKENRIPIASL